MPEPGGMTRRAVQRPWAPSLWDWIPALGALLVAACGPDPEPPPACVNGEDCGWVKIAHNSDANLVCALRAEGTVWCWGVVHQMDSVQQRAVFGGTGPGHVPIDGTIVDLSTRSDTICAVAQDGALWCWGDNYYGRVGDGTRTFRDTPTRVVGVDNAVDVEVGGGETCALADDRTIWCWGTDPGGDVIDPETSPVQRVGLESVVKLSHGQGHACALHENGHLYCWGTNSNGQIGMEDVHTRVSTFDPPYEIPGLAEVTDVDCGDRHTCAVVDNDSVWCWGGNEEHQLGVPTVDGTHVPTRVATLESIEKVYAGSFNTCASGHDGRLWCWGVNEYGEVGIHPYGSGGRWFYDLPVLFEHLTGVRSLSIKPTAIYAVTTDGTAWGWGFLQGLIVVPPYSDAYDFTWTPLLLKNPVQD